MKIWPERVRSRIRNSTAIGSVDEKRNFGPLCITIELCNGTGSKEDTAAHGVKDLRQSYILSLGIRLNYCVAGDDSTYTENCWTDACINHAKYMISMSLTKWIRKLIPTTSFCTRNFLLTKTVIAVLQCFRYFATYQIKYKYRCQHDQAPRYLIGDAENARHENAGLENVAQKYRAGKCRKRKCGTKPLRVENARMEKAGKEKYGKPYVK